MRSNTVARVIGILCVLTLFVIFLPASSHAASFKKSRPLGVMATAVDDSVAVTWESVSKAKGYRVYEKRGDGSFQKVKTTRSTKLIRSIDQRGVDYVYYVKAYQKVKKKGKKVTVWSKRSKKVYTTAPLSGKSTMKNFLRTALGPLGSTVYIWGGGWNKADTGSGSWALRTGLTKGWRTFANKQKSSYNYNRTRYQISKGLDCSGYVGWLVYNIMETENGKKGYVDLACDQGHNFARMKLGTLTSRSKVKDHAPGDIMEGDSHIWVSLGSCADGSTVVLHASPPGVKLSGTASKSGTKKSQAAKLAAKYMKKYYPSWYKRFPDATLKYPTSYNTGYNRFRFSSKILSDPDGYRKMSAEEVLKDLFAER